MRTFSIENVYVMSLALAVMARELIFSWLVSTTDVLMPMKIYLQKIKLKDS